MTRTQRDQWVAALRSGRYTQTTGYLYKSEGGDPGFCCLGVLCDSQRPLDGAWMQNASGAKAYVLPSGDKGRFELPDPVRRFYGLDYEIQQELTLMNDGAGGKHAHSFHEIAQWIEDNIPVTEE